MRPLAGRRPCLQMRGRGQVETETDDTSLRTFRSLQAVVSFGFDLTPSDRDTPQVSRILIRRPAPFHELHYETVLPRSVSF